MLPLPKPAHVSWRTAGAAVRVLAKCGQRPALVHAGLHSVYVLAWTSGLERQRAVDRFCTGRPCAAERGFVPTGYRSRIKS